MLVKYQSQSFKVARYCVRKQIPPSDINGKVHDAQLRDLDPTSQDILGDTWRTLDSMDAPVPVEGEPGVNAIDVEDGPGAVRPGTGVVAEEQVDSPSKIAVDTSLMDTDSTQMCIDSPDPLEAVPPMDIPVPSSPTSTYSWTPLLERHCGPLQDAPSAPDLKRPRSPSFVQEKRLKTDAL